MIRFRASLSLFLHAGVLSAIAVTALIFDFEVEQTALETKFVALCVFAGILATAAGVALAAFGWRGRFHPGLLLLAVWLVYHVVLIATHENRAYALQVGAPPVAGMALGLIAAMLTWDRRALGRLVGIAMLLAALIAVYALAQRMGLDFVDWYDPTQRTAAGVTSTLGNKNFVGSYLAVWLVFGIPFLLLPYGAVVRRVVLPGSSFDLTRGQLWGAALLGLVALAMLATLSRGALLGTLIGLAALVLLLLLWVRSWAARGLLVGCMVFAVAVGVLSAVYGTRFEQLRTFRRIWVEGLFVQSTSFANRLVLWRVATDMWQDAPVTGLGLGAYPLRFLDYFENLLLTDESGAFRDVARRMETTIALRAHNEVFQVLAEQGLVGFFLLVLLYVSVVHPLGAALARRARGGSYGWEDAARAGLFAGLLCYGGLAMWDFPLRLPANSLVFYVFVGLASALASARPVRSPSILRRAAGVLLGIAAIAGGTVLWRYGLVEHIANRHFKAGYESVREYSYRPDARLAASANTQLRRCLELSPAQGRAWFQLGNLAVMQKGNHTSALTLYALARRTYNNPSLLENEAVCLYEQRQYARADRYWRLKQVMVPEQRGSLLWRGKIAYRENDLERAIRLLKEEIDGFTPLDRERQAGVLAETYFYLGMAYYRQEEYQQAAHALTSALTLEPRHFQSNYYLGLIHADSEDDTTDLRRALYYLGKALEIAEELGKSQEAFDIRVKLGGLRARLQDAVRREEESRAGGG